MLLTLGHQTIDDGIPFKAGRGGGRRADASGHTSPLFGVVQFWDAYYGSAAPPLRKLFSRKNILGNIYPLVHG